MITAKQVRVRFTASTRLITAKSASIFHTQGPEARTKQITVDCDMSCPALPQTVSFHQQEHEREKFGTTAPNSSREEKLGKSMV